MQKVSIVQGVPNSEQVVVVVVVKEKWAARMREALGLKWKDVGRRRCRARRAG
jgi:hypothetical protein